MHPKIWILYLILPGRFGLLFSGLLIFAVLTVVFVAMGDVRTLFTSGALFFCAMPAYIVPVFGYINRISVQAVADLHDLLDMPQEELLRFQRAIIHRSVAWNILVTGAGLAGGVLHLLIIDGGRGANLAYGLSHLLESSGDVGALLVWVVMTITIFSLVQNGIRIGRLAHRLRPINLFRTDRLLPFARVAVSSSLALIGSLALYPLLSIDESISVLTALPGLVSTVVPMIAMLLMPMWPVHKLIKIKKAQEIAQLNGQLDSLQSSAGQLLDQARLDKINSVLDHRQHVQRVSDWPLDIGALSQLAFYLIIPPLTWVGAALIENVVDALL
jgi:hypothetical protein